MATAGAHTCAGDVDGETLCFGANYSQQLGIESVDSTCTSGERSFGCTHVSVAVATNVTFAALDVRREVVVA